MNRFKAQFDPPHIDIDVPEGLNTDQLRAWLIQKIEEIDSQRKRFQQTVQRYSNTGSGKKQYTPEQIALIRTERSILQEQRGAYRKLLGDVNAAKKELARIRTNQPLSRNFSEVFVEVANEVLSAQEFNRLFNETINRTTQDTPEKKRSVIQKDA